MPTDFTFDPSKIAVAAVPSFSGTSNLSGPIVVPLNLGISPSGSTISESLNLIQEQKNEIRFEWTEVQPALLPVDKANYNAQQFEIAQTDELNEIESRVYSLDMWRAGSDTANDIASFRVINYQYGKINTKKQIFPKQGKGQGQYGLLYKKMIIAGMSSTHMERSQIIKSNNALHAYFFNDAAEVLSLQGFLKTSSTDPWDIAMVLLWERLLRATELARHNAILEFAVADVIYWGYPLSFVPQISANAQFIASFSMQLLVIDKLLPLQNLDESVLELTTSVEQTNGFITTSQMTTIDTIGTITPIPDLAVSGILNSNTPLDDTNSIALGSSVINGDRFNAATIADILQTPGVPISTSTIPPTATALLMPPLFTL